MKQTNIHKNHLILFPVVVFFLATLIPVSALIAQDDEEDPIEIFWGEDEEGEEEFFDEEFDEFEDEDEFDEFEDEGEFDEDEGFFEEDEGDEFFEFEEDEEGFDEFDDEEDFEEDEGELEDVELADLAQRQGYTLTVMGASPGYVNHTLMTYNSSVDFKVGMEMPMLMQVGPLRFRFGGEVGTFSFENYLPVGGKYSGLLAMGILSFPAGPGQVKLGAGMVGGNVGFTAESSYGLALGNAVEIRFGVRSTMALGVKNTNDSELGTVSWMDGIIILGVSI